jgi:hypothetical protein
VLVGTAEMDAAPHAGVLDLCENALPQAHDAERRSVMIILKLALTWLRVRPLRQWLHLTAIMHEAGDFCLQRGGRNGAVRPAGSA